MSSEIASHICLPEPKLAFHPDRVSDRHIHPLLGLLRFGPYSLVVWSLILYAWPPSPQLGRVPVYMAL